MFDFTLTVNFQYQSQFVDDISEIKVKISKLLIIIPVKIRHFFLHIGLVFFITTWGRIYFDGPRSQIL